MSTPLTPYDAATYTASLLAELVYLVDSHEGPEPFDYAEWGSETLAFLAPLGKDGETILHVVVTALERVNQVQIHRGAYELNRSTGVDLVGYSDGADVNCHPGRPDDDGSALRALLCPWARTREVTP